MSAPFLQGGSAEAAVPPLGSEAQLHAIHLHPTVLLCITDHFIRLGHRRVIGAVLGRWILRGNTRILDVTNSFAVPFDQHARRSEAWFLDHNYLEDMAKLFFKVNASEVMVGWYSMRAHSSKTLEHTDLAIHEMFCRYCSDPVYIAVDATRALSDAPGLPVRAYVVVTASPASLLVQAPDAESDLVEGGPAKADTSAADTSAADTSAADTNAAGPAPIVPHQKTFEHVPVELSAKQSEEIAIEQLLRDIKGSTQTDLAQSIAQRIRAVGLLAGHLRKLLTYTQAIQCGDVPYDDVIVANLQSIFSLLPQLSIMSYLRASTEVANDHRVLLFVCTLLRAVSALHDLVNNRLDTATQMRTGTQPPGKSTAPASATK